MFTYADEGISGTKGREGRPEFDKLLKAIYPNGGGHGGSVECGPTWEDH
jgi:hypothetical protein